MNVTLLRTLTHKSILGFGKYAELSVRQIIDIKHTQYLRSVYYNFEGISFTDEVLKYIHIYDQEKIAKPGKDPEKHLKLNDIIFAITNKNKRKIAIISAVKNKKDMREENKRNYNYRKYMNAKYYLQSKNQGH